MGRAKPRRPRRERALNHRPRDELLWLVLPREAFNQPESMRLIPPCRLHRRVGDLRPPAVIGGNLAGGCGGRGGVGGPRGVVGRVGVDEACAGVGPPQHLDATAVVLESKEEGDSVACNTSVE